MSGSWVQIGGNFPPTLNTEDNPRDLGVNQTPACTGIELGANGYLGAGAIPTGSSNSFVTFSGIKLYGQAALDGFTYRKLYRRLWRSSENTLIYGAPNIEDEYFPQGLGKIVFDSSIVEFLPYGASGMAVFTTRGCVLLNGCDDMRGDGFFSLNHPLVTMTITAANKAVAFDRMVYASTADGLFQISDQGVQEITYPVRDTTSFHNKTLTFDSDKKYVIGSSYVIDTLNKVIYDYSSSSFKYTTPTVRDKSNKQFAVSEVGLEYYSTNGNSGNVTIEMYRGRKLGWSKSTVLKLDPKNERSVSFYEYNLPSVQSGDEFAIRLTALSTNIRIRSVNVFGNITLREGYHG